MARDLEANDYCTLRGYVHNAFLELKKWIKILGEMYIVCIVIQ